MPDVRGLRLVGGVLKGNDFIMKKKALCAYPPGGAWQRGEDRCQANVAASSAASVRECADLGRVAAILERDGFEAAIRDYQTEGVSFSESAEDVVSLHPDMLFASVTNGSIFDDAEWISCLRKRLPDVKIALKGAVFRDAPDEVLRLEGVRSADCLIGSEVEAVISEVAEILFSEEEVPSAVKGAVFSKNGTFEVPIQDAWVSNLDDMPFPARNLENVRLYVRPDTGKPMATIETARGCPSSCIYCLTPVISGKRVRKRSPESVVSEMTECFEKYGIDSFFMKADTFTIDAEWVRSFCDVLDSSPIGGKVTFTANSRAKPLDEGLMSRMRKSGCDTVAFGFESGSDETLARIRKGITTNDSRRAMSLARKAGLSTYGFFMIGFPWETEADVKKTIDFAFELNPDFIEIHLAMPFRGTELRKECELAGLIKESEAGKDYFSESATGTETVSPERLAEIRRKALLRFYARPSHAVRLIAKSAKNPRKIAAYAKYGMRLLLNAGKREKKHGRGKHIESNL